MRVKMSKQPPPASTASAKDLCPTVIKIVGRPGTGSLPSTIAPPPPSLWETARYGLKYCPKGPLNPKQPTNQPRETEKENRSNRREKNVKTTPSRTYCKCSMPLPYSNPNEKAAPALEVYPASSHHPTTPIDVGCWLVGCFGFNGLLRQYFSQYRAVSQREGEKGEKR